ncbi:MAG: hypothetical protein E6X17_14945 [Sporomusaceae bacterium]|nr:hypothetical protein [Sporomusaceae bacterium]
MSQATMNAITMGVVALPTMFLVIFVFMIATSALHKAFPAPAEGEEDED